MCGLENLELEFEIVTLTHNIKQLKKSGYRTEALQSRLEYCLNLTKFEKMDSFKKNHETAAKAKG